MEYTSRDIALLAATILTDKKALDVKVLCVENLTSIADYFVICSGSSSTHIKALCDEVYEKLAAQNIVASHSEGYRSASWILMDYGSFAVHIFTKEAHEFYSLERLWADAVQVQ